MKPRNGEATLRQAQGAEKLRNLETTLVYE